MFVLITYDVSHDKRRARLARLLAGYGDRVNYSVFECTIRDQDFSRLEEGVIRCIDPKEDHVRFYTLCGQCLPKVRSNGMRVTFEEEQLVLL